LSFQTPQKLSEKVQQGQTAKANYSNQTPRNISDGLRNLALAFFGLFFALFADFGFIFDKPNPSANGCI
jgi:hypothetical protein